MDSLTLLRKYTRHLNIAITDSGNNALMEALRVLRRLSNRFVVLVPDQGVSINYKDLVRKAGFEPIELKTNRGVISLDILRSRISNAAGLIMPSFAGFYAEQPIKEIGKICKQNACVLIEDASGSIGDNLLCDGSVSDIIFGDFGNWNLINYGKYGFISSNYNLNLRSVEYEFGLDQQLESASRRLFQLLKLSDSVKRDLGLMDVNIFHRDKRGLNIVTAYSQDVIDYCNSKGYEYVICPKYNKVIEKAISIELKRM